MRKVPAAEAVGRAGEHALDIKKRERAIEVMRKEIEMHQSALKHEINEVVG